MAVQNAIKKMKKKSKLIEDLKKHLEETPLEELKKEWEEVKEWENVGPSVKDFIEEQQKNELNDFMHKYGVKSIDFGKHKLNIKDKKDGKE